MVKQPRIPPVSPSLAWIQSMLFAFDSVRNSPKRADVIIDQHPSESTCHFVDGFGQSLDIPGSDTGDRNAPILRRIY
jgi:hypothetical protein